MRCRLSSGRLGSGPNGLLQRIDSAGLAACPSLAKPTAAAFVAASRQTASVVGPTAYFSGKSRPSRLPQPAAKVKSCRVRCRLSPGRLGSGPNGLLQRIDSAGLAACPSLAKPTVAAFVAASRQTASVVGPTAYFSGKRRPSRLPQPAAKG